MSRVRNAFFKAGAVSFIILGCAHTAAHLTGSDFSEPVLNTFKIMEGTTFQLLGEHNLMQFYAGFSLAMGFMFIAFGLQAFFVSSPSNSNIFVCIITSAAIFVIAVIYFHPLAYSLAGIALTSFVASFVKR